MTHPVLSDLGFVVNARTYYLSVLLCISRNDATRTVTLSKLLLSDSKALCDFINPFLVCIELEPFFFCVSPSPVFYLLCLFINVHSVTLYITTLEEAQNLLVCYDILSVSYTHLRAHETRHDLVCRLLLE